jgi:hypothetical protein
LIPASEQPPVELPAVPEQSKKEEEKDEIEDLLGNLEGEEIPVADG